MQVFQTPRSLALRPRYFSASDGGIEHSLAGDPQLFLDSLVYNLLFEEGGILVPDIFFFNCIPLIRHVQSSNWPLLAAGLKRGKIIPAFRDEKVETFSGALRSVSKDGIQGVEFQELLKSNTTPSKFAETLDEFVSRDDTKARRVIWPDRMGERFEAYAQRIFAGQQLPGGADERHAELWHRTSSWREEIPPAAVKATVRSGGIGLRRGEMINELGRRIGLLEGSGSFNRPSDLVLAAKAQFGGDSATVDELEFFVSTVNVLYQRNQADQFAAIHNSPPPVSPIAMSLFEPPSDQLDGVGESVTITLRLPSVESLLRNSGNVMAVRDSDPGQGFFVKRSMWMKNTIAVREASLRHNMTDAAQAYAKELRRVAPGPQVSAVLTGVLSGSLGVVATSITESLLDFMSNSQGGSYPHYALATGLGLGAVTALSVYRGPMRTRQVTVTRPRPAEINAVPSAEPALRT